MNKKVLVAISGGVDSVVTAILLRHHGYMIAGFHLEVTDNIDSRAARESAQNLASKLDFDLFTVDVKSTFRQKVIDYFESEYKAGRTPNPCVICNPAIKFRTLLKAANQHGFDLVATGHYARIKLHPATETYHLQKGKDIKKDQSYFLHRLDEATLKRTLFPLGDMTKDEVMALADEAGISQDIQPESQEICFLDRDYRHYFEEGIKGNSPEGRIITVDGKVKGYHSGLYRYTVGQRRGLGIPDSTPFYVISIDHSTNSIIIGKEDELWKDMAIIEKAAWISGKPPIEQHKYTVKTRYRHDGADAYVKNMQNGQWSISFTEPQRAITPGQFAVIYDKERVLGGGVICG